MLTVPVLPWDTVETVAYRIYRARSKAVTCAAAAAEADWYEAERLLRVHRLCPVSAPFAPESP